LEIVLDDPYQPVVVVRDEDGNTFLLERDALEEMTQVETDIEEDVDIKEDIPDWKADENYELEEKIRKIRYGGDPYYLARDMAMDEIIELENYIQERLKDERLPGLSRKNDLRLGMHIKKKKQSWSSGMKNILRESPLKSKPIVMEMNIWKLTLMGRKSRFMLITSTKSRKYLPI